MKVNVIRVWANRKEIGVLAAEIKVVVVGIYNAFTAAKKDEDISLSEALDLIRLVREQFRVVHDRWHHFLWLIEG